MWRQPLFLLYHRSEKFDLGELIEVFEMSNEDYRIGKAVSILFRYGQNFISRKLDHYNIGRGQSLLLITLKKKGGIRQEELACLLRIDKGTIAKSLKRLEEEGYIERKIDYDDKRANKVFLTQKAVDIMPAVEEAIHEWEEYLTSDFSDEDKKLAKHLLSEMAVKAHNIK